MQYNFPKMRGVEGRLEFFRKSIRFGSAIRPSVRTVSVGWQSKIFKEGISGGFAFATCTWNVSSVMCPLHQSLVWGITQVRGLHMKYCKRGEEKLIAGQQFPSFRTCNLQINCETEECNLSSTSMHGMRNHIQTQTCSYKEDEEEEEEQEETRPNWPR